MKKSLIKSLSLYHFIDGKKIEGKNKDMSSDYSEIMGKCEELWGDCSGIRGDCTRIWGDCTKLWGDCTGIRGDCTRIWGDLDECDISEKERMDHVNINDLINLY